MQLIGTDKKAYSPVRWVFCAESKLPKAVSTSDLPFNYQKQSHLDNRTSGLKLARTLYLLTHSHKGCRNPGWIDASNFDIVAIADIHHKKDIRNCNARRVAKCRISTVIAPSATRSSKNCNYEAKNICSSNTLVYILVFQSNLPWRFLRRFRVSETWKPPAPSKTIFSGALNLTAVLRLG